MNKYKIGTINHDGSFATKIVTTDGKELHFCNGVTLTHNVKVGDVIREYVEKSDVFDDGFPVAYSCNGYFKFLQIPYTINSEKLLIENMSRMERVRMNVAMCRALIKKGIIPTLSVANNLRMIMLANEGAVVR